VASSTPFRTVRRTRGVGARCQRRVKTDRIHRCSEVVNPTHNHRPRERLCAPEPRSGSASRRSSREDQIRRSIRRPLDPTAGRADAAERRIRGGVQARARQVSRTGGRRRRRGRRAGSLRSPSQAHPVPRPEHGVVRGQPHMVPSNARWPAVTVCAPRAVRRSLSAAQSISAPTATSRSSHTSTSQRQPRSEPAHGGDRRLRPLFVPRRLASGVVCSRHEREFRRSSAINRQALRTPSARDGTSDGHRIGPSRGGATLSAEGRLRPT
jgi:hypothetical protein